jgi:8-oxo-dGTP pyrophosphatase MutT (NUDIX family)
MSSNPPDSPEKLSTGPRRGVVAVIPRGDALLVIQRSYEVRAPGAYCFPGGGVEPGESEPAALVRELREELALVVSPLERLWNMRTAWGVDLAWWLADAAAQQPCPNPAEVAQVLWLPPDEIRRLPNLLSSNHAFLDFWITR